MTTRTATSEDPRSGHLLAAMTVEEKVALLAGASMWELPPIPRLNIPAFRVSDGPNGARGSEGFVGGSVTSAAFPVGIALAATWNVRAIFAIGSALGEEAIAKGARLLLGPTMNAQRSPLNGRNFECYSEDPYLSARMAVGYIQGLQSRGVGATAKHYVLNDSEFERNSIDVIADERTLREISLPPFYAAVHEAGTWAVMTAYNRIDGVYAGENPKTVRGILKDEWGFDGLVMSDWFGTHSTADAINAGLDLEMPGPSMWRGAKLLAAIDAGEVDLETVDDATRRVLRTMTRTGTLDQPEPVVERAINRLEHRALIRSTGAESIVLLKNERSTLPLARESLTKVAVIGPNAKVAQIMGGGSAQVNAHYAISPWDALSACLPETVELTFAEGTSNGKRLPFIPQDLLSDHSGTPYAIDYFANETLSGTPVHRESSASGEHIWFTAPVPSLAGQEFSARITTTFTPDIDGNHTFSLTSAGLSRLLIDGKLLVDNWDGFQQGDYFFGFGSSEQRAGIELAAGTIHEVTVEYRQFGPVPIRAVRIGYAPPLDPDAIAKAASLAAAADVALLFVGLNAEWDSEGQDRPGLELPGEQDALIAAVAAANPRTVVVLQSGGPVAMPWLEEIPALIEAWYPGQECGNAIADVLFGTVNPSGKLPQTFPARIEDNPAYLNYPGENGRVSYGERFYIGYRWYDARAIEPLFPFGFGLSYTTFAYGEMRLSTDVIGPGETLDVEIDVSNTGDVVGSEVIQLYVSDHDARLSRPIKELKAFAKVEIAPGATETVRFTLDRSALAYWDDRDHQWIAEAGTFEVLIGSSAAEIHARSTFTLTKSETFLHP